MKSFKDPRTPSVIILFLMRILTSIDELATLKGPIVLAAGTFDGLHLGHQALILRAVEEAMRVGGTAVVMSFDRHPASILRPQSAPRHLSTNRTKIRLLDEMGVTVLLLLKFTPELASITAEEFIATLVAASHPLHMICVGSQWSFGRGGAGSIPLLEKLGARQGFSVTRIDPVESGGLPINSTRIRTAVAFGDFVQAAACLGRPYLLSGTVVTGAGLGSVIGFPTANLDVDGMQLPPEGVYAVRVFLEEQCYSGVANVGRKPTVDPTSKKLTVEVHLFDFSGNLVGKELYVEFMLILRGEAKFSGLDALKSQIAIDCEQAKGLLMRCSSDGPQKFK